MNQYRISFYDHNAIDPRDRDQIQHGIINANSEDKAREIFNFTNCEVVSLELVVKSMEEIKADYFADYGADYQERNDLYYMGMGG